MTQAEWGPRLALRIARRGGATLAETCVRILELLDPDAAVLAVTAAGTALHRVLGREVAPHRLFRHDPPERDPFGRDPFARADRPPPLHLADRDRDGAPSDLPWPAPPPGPATRLRRADTLYADSHRVGLIASEDAAGLAALLRGARRILADRPALAVDLAAIPPPDRPAFWEALVQAWPGYAWHDGLLFACPDPPTRGQTLAGGERVIAGLPPAAASGDDLSCLAHSNWRGAVPRDPHSERIAVRFDPDLPCAGFHPAETDGSGWWRWTGPSSHASFAMPLPEAGRWRLGLEIIAGPPDRLRAVFAGGRRLARDSHGSFGPVAVDPAAPPARLLVALATAAPVRASASDARRVGLCLAGAALDRVG